MKNFFNFQTGYQLFKEASCTIPGQDMSISELLARFSRGERLNVKERPQNFLQPGEQDETEENILPQLDDITELEEYQQFLLGQKLRKTKSSKKESNERKEDKSKDLDEKSE